jgi:hypothetical protein
VEFFGNEAELETRDVGGAGIGVGDVVFGKYGSSNNNHKTQREVEVGYGQ